MKNIYEKPSVEVISLEPMDIITDDGVEGGDNPSTVGGAEGW